MDFDELRRIHNGRHTPARPWYKGVPPSIGWWPASCGRVPDSLRWWNGTQWSDIAVEGMSVEEVTKRASTPSQATREVFWTNRPVTWPKHSLT